MKALSPAVSVSVCGLGDYFVDMGEIHICTVFSVAGCYSGRLEWKLEYTKIQEQIDRCIASLGREPTSLFEFSFHSLFMLSMTHSTMSGISANTHVSKTGSGFQSNVLSFTMYFCRRSAWREHIHNRCFNHFCHCFFSSNVFICRLVCLVPEVSKNSLITHPTGHRHQFNIEFWLTFGSVVN